MDIHLGKIKIDAVDYGSQGSAILGIRDSGKTYTATWFAERLFEAGIPFVAFDPIGVWRFLRVPSAGRGYPIVVAGGVDGDLPLSPESAPAIVEAAMQQGVSLVIDLFHIDLSKADWRRIVRDSVRLLLHKNSAHGLRHVFIEEAAEFAPQKVTDGLVYSEMEKLARMGGNARLGYTLINQRAEEVNKALLELCDNLFLHRQKGKNSLLSLNKWLDAGDVAGGGRAIVKTLPLMPQGECWAWLSGSDTPVRVKVPAKNSLHPDRRVMRGDAVTQISAPVGVGQFVEAMKGTLASLSATPKEDKIVNASAEQIAEAAERGYSDGLVDGDKRGYARGLAASLEAIVALQPGGLAHPVAVAIERPSLNSPASVAETRSTPSPEPKKQHRKANGSGNPAGEKLLTALAHYPATPLSWIEVCVAAGMVHGNGYFYGGAKWLRDSGFVDETARGVTITDAGLAVAGGAQPSFTRGELAARWSAKLKQPSPMMLEALLHRPAHTFTVDELAEKTRLKPGNGYWYGGISGLRENGIIEQPSKAQFRLSDFMRAAPP